MELINYVRMGWRVYRRVDVPTFKAGRLDKYQYIIEQLRGDGRWKAVDAFWNRGMRDEAFRQRCQENKSMDGLSYIHPAPAKFQQGRLASL
jgi:hypothetical protein